MLQQGDTVQSQYSASPIMKALVESMRVRIIPYADIDLFYRQIFDIETAQGIGLDIWGRILGIGRRLTIPDTLDYLGFDEAGADSWSPFDVDIFLDGDILTTDYDMNDNAYRQALMWKALANITTADAKSFNELMQGIFTGQDIVVHEHEPMEIELYIFFQLEDWQRAFLNDYGFMAKGAGVHMKIFEVPFPCFGFAEAGYYPFDDYPMFANLAQNM